MTATVESDLSRRQFNLCSSAEWQSVCSIRHNLLLEGPEVSTDAALLLLKPHLRNVVDWRRPGASLELPTSEADALILQNVGDLAAKDQARLLAWLSATGQRTQVVSTTAHSLFALVARGLFDDALYYRLNLVLLQVDFSDRRGPARVANGGASSDRRAPAIATAKLL